jgi:hypothetical protein
VIQIVPIQENDLPDYIGMINGWLSYFDNTEDSMKNGKKYDARSIVLTDRKIHGIEYLSISDGVTVGVTAHRENGDFMDGVMLWIEPEFRGNVSLQEVFDELLNISVEKGKSGIRFESKIWGNSPRSLGFERVETKQDGTDIVCVWQRTKEK